MNPAYKHLDAKLRLAELTIGQWLGAVCGLGGALLWGFSLSPFGPTLTLVSAIYVGALPAGAAFVASVSEVDVWLIVRSAAHWRRSQTRFVAGAAAAPARGYLVHPEAAGAGARDRPVELAEIDLASLWKES
jgi:hypothetical protein